MNKILGKFKTFISKKLLVAVFTAGLVFVNNKFQLGIDEQTMNRIVEVIVTYIIGQAVVDVAAVVSKTAPNPPSIGQLDYPQGDGSVVFAPPNMNNM